MSRYCVWVVVVVVAMAGCGGGHRESAAHAGGPTLTDALARTLDAQFRREVTLAGIAGASAAIVFPDGREWSRAVGAAELKPRVAMTTRTSFHFNSVTKMAIASRCGSPSRAGCASTIRSFAGTPRGAVTARRPCAICSATLREQEIPPARLWLDSTDAVAP
jgi:hypothetical protein